MTPRTPPRPAPAGHRTVTVVGPDSALDVMLPDSACGAALVPDLLDLLTGPGSAAAEHNEDVGWTLCRVGGRALPAAAPLSHCVSDGEVLYLVPDAHRFVPPAISDGDGLWREPAATDRWTATDTARLLVAVAVLVVLAAAVPAARLAAQGPRWWWAPGWAAAVAAVVALASAVLATSRSRSGALGVGVATAALPLWVLTGLALSPPDLATFTGVAPAAGLALAGVLVVVATVLRARPQRVYAVAVAVAVAPAAVVVLAVAVLVPLLPSPPPAGTVAAALLAVLDGTALVLAAPVAVRLSRHLRHPDPDADPAAAPDDESVATALTGVLAGLGAGLAGAWAVLSGTGGLGAAVLLVTVALAALQTGGVLRRVHRLVTSTVLVAGLACVAVWWLTRQTAPAAVFALVSAVAGLALLGLRRTRPHPVTEPDAAAAGRARPQLARLANLAERLLLVACVPLLAALAGFFVDAADFGFWWGR